jgi:hypothetical protein
MAENKSSTPEQQLLKLIEETQKGQKAGAPPRAVVHPRKAGFSLGKLPGAFLGRLSFLKRGGKKRATHRKVSFNIADMNKLLYVAVACLLLYVVFDAVASATSLRRPPNFLPPKDMRFSFVKGAIEPLRETSYYLQKISARDIFKEGKKVEEVKEEKPKENAVVETAQAIQNLALVGISWSSNPDAIIEDKAHQRTFFVKRGQMAGDDVKVEAIFKDHVVVSFEDKEYELR